MKDKIKYYLLLLAFLFIMALILWFFHDWIEPVSYTHLAQDLGSCEVIRVGSTPTTRTIIGPNIDTMC